MRSIVVTRFRPDRPKGGAAIRNWQNINALSALGPVDVISVGPPTQTGDPIPGVRAWRHFAYGERPLGARLLARTWRFWPDRHPGVQEYWHPLAARRIAADGPYDVGVIEELSLARFTATLKRHCARLVYDAHNVEAELRAAIRSGSDAAEAPTSALDERLRREEAGVIAAADVIWACSAADADAIVRIYKPRARIAVVPNGMRPEDFAAIGPPPRRAAPLRPLSILYAGTFSYYPNEDAALRLATEIAPALRARGVDAEIVLVGRRPTEAMVKAAAAEPMVRLVGEVPDMEPYLAAADIVAAPIRLGSGTRLKLLEAFAARRPVVTTAKGIEGIDAEPGVHALFAETPDAFAEAVAALAAAPDRGARIAEAAFDLLEAKYSWRVAAARIAKSLRETAQSDYHPADG